LGSLSQPGFAEHAQQHHFVALPQTAARISASAPPQSQNVGSNHQLMRFSLGHGIRSRLVTSRQDVSQQNSLQFKRIALSVPSMSRGAVQYD
jgi:hypothetical protein